MDSCSALRLPSLPSLNLPPTFSQLPLCLCASVVPFLMRFEGTNSLTLEAVYFVDFSSAKYGITSSATFSGMFGSIASILAAALTGKLGEGNMDYHLYRLKDQSGLARPNGSLKRSVSQKVRKEETR